MKKGKVYLVGGGPGYREMFEEKGWDLAFSVKEADLVQFTGGADVTPALYKQHPHPRTNNNPLRDQREAVIFEVVTQMGKPMAGICRGGQFLNVMMGGDMWQDVNNHALGGELHEAFDHDTGRALMVSSTHHQMMRPFFKAGNKKVQLLMTAKLSTVKEKCRGFRSENKEPYQIHVSKSINDADALDVEACIYPYAKVLCFQPHPEFGNAVGDCRTIYFKYLDMLLSL